MFDDESAVLGGSGRFAEAAHVLGVDAEEVLVPHHQVRDGDAGAVVVLDTRVPLLRWEEVVDLLRGVEISS